MSQMVGHVRLQAASTACWIMSGKPPTPVSYRPSARACSTIRATSASTYLSAGSGFVAFTFTVLPSWARPQPQHGMGHFTLHSEFSTPIHFTRWACFDSLLPKTALVQDRSAGPRQLFTLAAMTAIFAAWAWMITRRGQPISPTRL